MSYMARKAEASTSRSIERCEMANRTIGITRPRAKIGMANVAFNMKRLVFWERRGAAA